ncbi:MAG: endonuclease III [Proteobacteria bacterium]|nr:endonuclease III [Pseudomonadota bacterium]
MTQTIEPFSIDRFIAILKEHYKNWDAPVITLMSHAGASPYQVLISTVLSLRTRDEVTAVAAKRLFDLAKDPNAMLALGEEAISKAIYPVGFYPTKAKRIMEISRLILDKFNGVVPDEIDLLLTLPGVGRKTANLVLVEGYHKDAICVDTHVHRISNRIAYVKTPNPDKTEMALRKKLPRPHWVIYNEILVAFGQLICRPISPFCSRCPVSQMCQKVNVTTSR